MKIHNGLVLGLIVVIMMVGVVTANTVTENTDMGWETVINHTFSSVPDSMFISSTSVPYTSTNTTLLASNGITYWNATNPFTGGLFLGQLYPAGRTRYRLNITITSDATTPSVNMKFGNLIDISVVKYASSYRVYMYYYFSNGTLNNTYYFGVTMATTPYVDLYIDYYPNGTAFVWNNRDQNQNLTAKYRLDSVYPYNYISPTMLSFSIIKSSANKINVTFYNFEQQIPKKLITINANNDTFPLGFDGVRGNYSYGTNWLKNHGQTATLWIDETYYPNLNSSNKADVQDLINNQSFELGIHYSIGLTSVDLSTANTTMTNEYNNVSSLFGNIPVKSWDSLANADNSTHAKYMYDNYNSVWRNSPNSINAFSNIGNIYSNYSTVGNTTQFFKDASQHKTYSPTFTHSVITPLNEGYSMNQEDWDSIMGNYTNNSIKIIPYARWYQENNNTVQPITNVYFSSNQSYFNINTSGYNATTIIYDPNGIGNEIWYSTGGSVKTDINNSNITNLIINNPTNLTVQKANATIIPSTYNLNVTITTWNSTNAAYNESSSNSTNEVAYHIGDRTPSTNYTVKVYWNNGTKFQDLYVTSNSTGYLNYNSTGYNYPRYTVITWEEPSRPYTIIAISATVIIGGIYYILKKFKINLKRK